MLELVRKDLGNGCEKLFVLGTSWLTLHLTNPVTHPGLCLFKQPDCQSTTTRRPSEARGKLRSAAPHAQILRMIDDCLQKNLLALNKKNGAHAWLRWGTPSQWTFIKDLTILFAAPGSNGT